MPDPPHRAPREGDELWFGLVRVPVSDEMTPERERWIEAGRVARAAHSREDLSRLVATHPDYRVRYEAIPRLRARIPDAQETFDVLASASLDPDAGVRDAAVAALRDLPQPGAADLVAARLADEDFDVRLTAARSLALLGDDRAPADPEAWALESMVQWDADG